RLRRALPRRRRLPLGQPLRLVVQRGGTRTGSAVPSDHASAEASVVGEAGLVPDQASLVRRLRRPRRSPCPLPPGPPQARDTRLVTRTCDRPRCLAPALRCPRAGT